MIGCDFSGQPKDDKVPREDTTVTPIDTLIIEDGVPPTDVNAKVKPNKKEKYVCSFGFKKLNSRKRPIEEAPGGKKGKPVKPGTEPPLPPLPPPTDPNPVYSNVIYINYFGKNSNGGMWGTVNVGDAGLAQPEIDYITTAVAAHFPDYNIRITQDKAIFDAAQIGHKIEVVVTEDWQWYGQCGGVAYINSFTWSDGSPAFVFSTLLSYNSHYIAEAIAHEAGHTLGLRHQSECVNGVKTVEYSYGKTMGNSYGSYPQGAWVIGVNPFCTTQDDNALLTAAVGRK